MNNEKKLNVPRPNAYIYITRLSCRHGTFMSCLCVCVCVCVCVCAGACANMKVYIVNSQTGNYIGNSAVK